MSLLDFSKNCNITTHSFSEDLLSFTVTNDQILWENNEIEGYAIRQNLFSSEGTNNFWTPAFVSDDDLITNKLISHYGSIRGDSNLDSGRIGIENFITFNPKFKNWTFTNGLMVIDWIMNRSRVPYNVKAGLMYWKKNNTPVTGNIESFPLYSKIKHNNIEYIKLDNDTLRRLTVKQNVFRNSATSNADSPITFSYTGSDSNTLVSSLGDNPIFTLVGSDDVEVWIPDGDQLLYFTNSSEERQNNTQNIASRSYVSGSLYKYYNIFYNSLTADQDLIKITDSRSVHTFRQYKKLAHSLATSPFSSEFFVALLAKPSTTIRDSINTYLTTNISSIAVDINNLTTVLNTISAEYGIYEIQNNSNIVKNNDQLFLKLFNKYGAKLQLSNDARVNYTPSLTYGDSVLVEEIGETLASKNITNTIVSNNKTTTVGNLSVETSIGPSISSILLRHRGEVKNTIHLYDSVKPNILENSNINIVMEKNNNVDNFYKNEESSIPDNQDYDPNNNIFYWGPRNIDMIGNNLGVNLGNASTNNIILPKLKVVNTDLLVKFSNARFPNQAQEIINRDFVPVWTKVSGPDLKFVDLNKTQTNKSYNIAYSNEVAIVPSSTGKYVIKCVVSSPYGSYTKIKTIFIVDGRERNVESDTEDENSNFATYSENNNIININTIDRALYAAENAPISLNTDNLKVFIAGLDSFAIHRNGLYAPIKTNYYVERVTTDSRPIEKLDTNYFFTFDKNPTQQTISPKIKNSFFSINYRTNNTIIKLDRIILRNIRNQTTNCSQCYSLYRPKLRSFARRQVLAQGPGSRTFYNRSNKDPEGFVLQKYLPDTVDRYFPSEFIDYKYPVISNDIAPPIKTYGGYGHNVLDKLTINNLTSLPIPKKVNPNMGLIAEEPQFLPSVTGYKLDYKDDYNIDYKLCYQENVMPSGHILFNKGTFVPGRGWVVGDNRNLSSVLKFNPGARKSFSFSGPGILGLSNYTNTSTIQPNTFSSSIELNINPLVQWDNGGPFRSVDETTPGAAEINRNRRAVVVGNHNMRNPLNKELADQVVGGSNNYHHGYRSLNGGDPKGPELRLTSNSAPQNDEFNINIDENSNKFIYSFNVVGPNNQIGLDDETREFIDLYQGNGIGPGDPGTGEATNEQGTVRNFIESRGGLGTINPRINNLTIKDVEIQLNFLNYVNTKNLIIWLEVEFSESEKENMKLVCAQRGPCTARSQIQAQNNFIDQFIPNNTHKAFTVPDGVRNSFFVSDNISVGNSNINLNLKQLTNLNSRDIAGEKNILYLLNQETIQNKEYNFSVKFSDSANKHNVLYDHNFYSNGSIDPDQNIVSNKDSVNPSKSVDGYNTFTNSNFSNLNKLNRLNINNNTFNKLADRKLFIAPTPDCGTRCTYLFPDYRSSTKFTLHITILEEEDEMFPMDTLINNEIYTNIASVENNISSANLFNNLCSWELILHTEDVKKPVTSQVNSLANYGGTDSLGLIEYGTDPKYPGYSFIANLRNSKFLLPLVNMNAPTTFFQNYNSCEYADNELIGKGTLISQPRFPSEALLLILAGTAVGGMSGSLVGVLVGGLGPTYALGFDLLFAYFAASRTAALLETIQRDVFDIGYEGYPFGNSDKILLNISKDGVFWYKVEASIFKLSNTPALPLKEYKLIKRDNKLFRFDFSIVFSNSEIIDDIFIPYIVAQATPEDADEETIANYQDINNSVYDNFDFMSVNELVFANKLIQSENIFQYTNKPNQTLIIIDHSMPYYLIGIGDVITLDCENNSAIVMSKALVYKDSKYQTVLVLNKSVSNLEECSSFLLPEDVVVLLDNNFTIDDIAENFARDNDKISPISLFGLINDQPPNDEIPDLTFSTNSLGSYGNGSPVKEKNILSRKVKINNIDPIYHQLNSFNNDKYYYNELSLILNDELDEPMAPLKINNRLEAYPVYYDGSTNNIVNNNLYHIYDNTFNNPAAEDNTQSLRDLLDNINTSIKDNKTYVKDQSYNMMYLKVKDNTTINSLFRNLTCSITIEDNYTYNKSILKLDDNTKTTLNNRLDKLNVTENATLDLIVGNVVKTSDVLKENSIFYIQQHYDILNNDPDATDARLRTYNILQKLYQERSEILELLENQNKPESANYHFNDGGIIPDYRANVVVSSPQGGLLNNSIDINYEKISEDYYWINIDPKQSISISEEMRPRVLKSVTYVCQTVNPVGSVQLLSFNNICPDFFHVNNLESDILKITADSTGTTYTFKDDFIQQQKNTWPGQTWKTQQIERKFRINAEKSSSGLDRNNDEFLVTAIEIYEVAIDITENIKSGDLAPGDYSGDVYGLLKNSLGSPVGKPTRVYNIFNLDDIKQLKVQFRKSPRTIRGIDAIGTVLRYGENDSYRPQGNQPFAPLDIPGVRRSEHLINNFYQWKCLQKNPVTNRSEEAGTPEFFQLLNEMIFRTFFGSVDEIENKNTELKSLYDFEMIPYEYFTRPQPPSSP